MANSKEIEDLFKVLNKKLNALRLEIDESIVDNIFESVVAIEQFKAQQNENIENHALKTDAHLSIEQKPVDLWEVKWSTSSIADTGDYYTQYWLDNETIHKTLFLQSDDEEDYIEMAEMLNKSAMQQPTDEEIEAMAKREYPSWYTEWEDGIRYNAFIKGFKAALNQK